MNCTHTIRRPGDVLVINGARVEVVAVQGDAVLLTVRADEVRVVPAAAEEPEKRRTAA